MDVKKLSMTAAITALTCLAGMLIRWVSPGLVPFSILPIMPLVAGIILGANYGALAMSIYALLGLFGLPVFSSAPFGGLAYLAKPTFGYILGYIGAAYVTGKVYRPGKLWSIVLAVLGGLTAIYGVGLAYLYAILTWVLHNPTNLKMVFAVGFTPFIVSDLMKAGIAAWVGNEVVRRREKSI